MRMVPWIGERAAPRDWPVLVEYGRSVRARHSLLEHGTRCSTDGGERAFDGGRVEWPQAFAKDEVDLIKVWLPADRTPPQKPPFAT